LLTDGDPMSATPHAPSAPFWAARSTRFGSTLRTSGYLKRAAAAIWMNVLIVAVISTSAVTTGVFVRSGETTASVRALTLFAIWLLAFVPGWLYVRFLGLRADALWSEYVLNLYRLGVDDVKYLPPPPAESGYAEYAHAGVGGSEAHNIYRQKFNAYYGRQVSKRTGENFNVSVETLFPVFLCTATLAVAWTVILWKPAAIMNPVPPWAGLEFGFLGAYAFAVSMLVRRFYQSDLRPSAYASVVLRIVIVLLILIVVHQLFMITNLQGASADQSEFVCAFVIGFFPLVGLQALQRVAAKVLGVVVPQLAPQYPLEQLDGLNIWYEARLVEEGVEDMQNLTTMNLVDVLLHTRAPVGRLVDWIDQAFLLIHLDSATRDEIEQARKSPTFSSGGGAATRIALRRIGVRSATDFLKTFGGSDITAQSVRGCGLEPCQVQLLLRLIGAERGLDPVWNWKAGGAKRVEVSA
jgi:hypothetical protein